MKYKQMQMILEPISIEKLFEEKVDKERSFLKCC